MATTDYQQKEIEKTGKTQYVNKGKLENENYTATDSSENTGRDVRGINAIVAGTSKSAKHDELRNALVNIKLGNTKDFKNVVPYDSGSEYSTERCDSQPEKPASFKGLPADASLKEDGESKDCFDQQIKHIVVPSGVKYGSVKDRHQSEFKPLYEKRENSDDPIHTSFEQSKLSNDDQVLQNTENCSSQSQSKDENETSAQESINPSETKSHQIKSLISREFTSRSHCGGDEFHKHRDLLTEDGPEEQTYEGNGKLNSCAVMPKLIVLSSQTSEKSEPNEVVQTLLPTRSPTCGEIHIQKSPNDGKFIDLKSKQFESKRSLPKYNGYGSIGYDLRRNPARNKRHLPSSNKEEADFYRCYISKIIFIMCCLLFCQKVCMKQKKYLCGTLTRDIIMNSENRMPTVILALPDYIPSLHEIRNILNDRMSRELWLRDHGFRLATFSTTANNIEGTLKLASHGFFCDTDGKIKCRECAGEYTSPGIADQDLQSAHLLGCSCRHFVGPVGNSIQDTYGSQTPEMLLYGIRGENQIEGGGVQQQDGTIDENEELGSNEMSAANSLPYSQERIFQTNQMTRTENNDYLLDVIWFLILIALFYRNR